MVRTRLRLRICGAPSPVRRGGTSEPVTQSGAFAGLPSRDGKYLYYAYNSPSSSLWELELAGGKSKKIAESVLNRGYAALPDGLVFAHGNPLTRKQAFARYSPESGEVTPLMQLEQRLTTGISLSPDGNSLSYTGVDRAGHELFLVKNFWH